MYDTPAEAQSSTHAEKAHRERKRLGRGVRAWGVLNVASTVGCGSVRGVGERGCSGSSRRRTRAQGTPAPWVVADCCLGFWFLGTPTEKKCLEYIRFMMTSAHKNPHILNMYIRGPRVRTRSPLLDLIMD